ncbi:MAG: exodeoxyribonuclease V subunit beta [Burkholderiaceae bacterium]
MSAAPARDPYLELPLDGVRLVEASAGTGKTFTLATLVTRMVVERSLRVGQVLAVTFTEAATQELRKRIRERLLLALELVDAPVVEGEDAEAALTRAILHAHLARSGERAEALRRRLREAALEIDLAAIFTIHGFCARVLREHALESGQGFDPPELLANDRGLREELAADLWRMHGRDAAGAEDLAALWKGGPTALAADLSALMREPLLVPPDAPLPSDPMPAVLAAGSTLADGFRAHGQEFLAVLLDALARKVLHGGSYKPAWIQSLWASLAGWCEGGDYTAPLDEKLARLTPAVMQEKTNKAHVGNTPQSPVCAMIDDYLRAVADSDAYRVRRRIALLHRIRGDARDRLAMLKRQRRLQTYDDMIDGVADALDGERGDALARNLRAQYAVALVDEFQDTDPRQWKIFDRVFGGGGEHTDASQPALFLVGDPKQAIYGFRGGDVHTYLAARGTADEAPPLAHNFRSRPCVLAAIEALYAQAGDDAFVDPRIRFRAVEAGGARSDDDFQRSGSPAPALTIWRAPAPKPNDKGEVKPWKADASREQCTAACVAAIHAVLSEGRAGTASIEGKPLQPGDIAVLVRTHSEATRIQQALAAVGIPAVAAGKQSLFATLEARELHALLLALLQSGDDGRLRAALSTVLVGVDAEAIAALDGSDHDWQHKALAWRERLLRGGPLALIGDLCAQHAPRLLGLSDGERRVGNYLQLAEALQEAQAETLGLHGLVDWLGTRIANADPNDETQLLRLESDARRVQIVTLHKSKGLEYPLVFIPFAGIGRPAPAPGRFCVAQGGDDNERRLHWKIDVPEAEWEDAKLHWSIEQHAEHARLLYVGLTRARHALWLASGMFYNGDKAALAPMLADLAALQDVPCIRVDTDAPPIALPRLPPESDAAVPPAAVATRVVSNDWWVHSFSSLTRKTGPGEDASTSATLPAPGGTDEPASAEDDPGPVYDPRFAGAQFGVAMHTALERTDFAAWRGWLPGDAAPGNEADTIADALREQGYAEDLLEDGIALVTSLVGRTLRVVLPEGVQLCNVPGEWRRPEIEFQFPLQPTRVEALLQLLHAYDVVPDRHAFGFRQRLEGLMTGLVDLTYQHDGRWYVLDYKSNRLVRYDADALGEAMQHSEYDLQALIYTLALHRWLRFRLGDNYDYARDFGGHRYVFSRGIELGVPAHGASPGVHARKFEPALIHALDALFAGAPA